jgi:phage tail sheath protein FI
VTIPGPVFTDRDAAQPTGTQTDTGAWFVPLPAERGPVTPTSVTSPDDFARVFGQKVSYSIASDAITVAFAEGAQRVVFARVVGPAATKASKTLNDSGAAPSLKVEAIGPDTYSNGLKVAVSAGAGGGTFVLVITDSANVELERSPDLADVASAVFWGSLSDYVRVVALGTNNPATLAAASLSGGTDDRANITDASYRDALALFTPGYGPGQESIPGRVSGTAHADLIASAKAHRRVAILDVGQTDTTKSAMKTLALAARSVVGSEKAAMFGPWATVPGSIPGTVRDVPYSAIVAGHIARSDARTLNPNLAAAGPNGVSSYAVGVKGSPFSDADRGELNDAGLNLALFSPSRGAVMTYGFRTLADPLKLPNQWQLANVRLDMAVTAGANIVAEEFEFSQLDQATIQRFGGELGSMLSEFLRRGALYGGTPDEAYRVDVSSTVNTPASLARGELRAVISIRRSPVAEVVKIDVVRVSVAQAI